MDAGLSSSPSTLANGPLLVRAPRTPPDSENLWGDDPMSPTGRVMEDTGICIVVTLGLAMPLDLPIFRSSIETELLTRFPRFNCVQVTGGSKTGEPRWVRTTVNMDDHIIVPELDPAAVASNPDQVLEDYVASLSTLPMDRSRPLWEFHFLDFPTSEATSTVVLRLHHSIGDGVSVTSLFMASSRCTADQSRLPAMPPPPRRTGAIYKPSRPSPKGGALAFLAWVWSYFVLVWHTAVDVALLVATILFLKDPNTLLKCAYDGDSHRKRFVHRSLSVEDVKFIRTALNCTINDVLVGVTSAALSRYYFRKSSDINTKEICLRSVVMVNARPTSSHQIYVNKVEQGNRLGYLICPFHIAMHEDPLEYVRKAKRIMHRKKSSLEVKLTETFLEFFVKYLGEKAGSVIFGRFLTRTTMLFSNAIGPAEPITLCGHPVSFIAPSIYGSPQALTVHYHNYGSIIKVVLAVDDAEFPDCHQLLDDFSEAIKLIKDAAGLNTSTATRKNV